MLGHAKLLLCTCFPKSLAKLGWVYQSEVPTCPNPYSLKKNLYRLACGIEVFTCNFNSQMLVVSCHDCGTSHMFHAKSLEKATGSGLNVWTPVTHVTSPEEAPFSWYQPGPVLVIVIIWEVNQQVEDLSCCLLLPFCDSDFQINTWILKKKETKKRNYTCTVLININLEGQCGMSVKLLPVVPAFHVASDVCSGCFTLF